MKDLNFDFAFERGVDSFRVFIGRDREQRTRKANVTESQGDRLGSQRLRPETYQAQNETTDEYPFHGHLLSVSRCARHSGRQVQLVQIVKPFKAWSKN